MKKAVLIITITITMVFSLEMLLISPAAAEGGVRIESVLGRLNPFVKSTISCPDCEPFDLEKEMKVEAKQRGHPTLVIRLADGRELKFIMLKESNLKEEQIQALYGKSFIISSVPTLTAP